MDNIEDIPDNIEDIPVESTSPPVTEPKVRFARYRHAKGEPVVTLITGTHPSGLSSMAPQVVIDNLDDLSDLIEQLRDCRAEWKNLEP